MLLMCDGRSLECCQTPYSASDSPPKGAFRAKLQWGRKWRNPGQEKNSGEEEESLGFQTLTALFQTEQYHLSNFI